MRECILSRYRLLSSQCATDWIDQVAGIGEMSEQQRKLGQGMTTYYITDVLRAQCGKQRVLC
jgi:hypothetical protein